MLRCTEMQLLNENEKARSVATLSAAPMQSNGIAIQGYDYIFYIYEAYNRNFL